MTLESVPVTALKPNDKLAAGHTVKSVQLVPCRRVAFIQWADGHSGDVPVSSRYLVIREA